MFASKDIFLKSSGGGYQISRSVRLRSSASAYLNRTFAGAGNTKTWTWSGWVKRGVLGAKHNLFGTIDLSATNRQCYISFEPDNTLTFLNYTTSGYNYYLQTTQVFRDPSAWYHIVCVSDTSQATAANRLKIYVNGVQVTSFSTATYPSQNFDGWVNANTGAGVQLGIGRVVPYASSEYFDGYQTEINFIDGQALTPSSFGETNAATGVWQPKAYKGTYGTNGFYLNFSDNSTAAALGTDFSGNSNTWTVNNISVTAGVTYDSFTDVPTPYADGGTGRGNYAVGNPLAVNVTTSATATLTNGNLLLTNGSATYSGFPSTMSIPVTGKWAWKFKVTGTVSGSNDGSIGFACNSSGNPVTGASSGAAANWYTTVQVQAVSDRGVVHKYAGGSVVTDAAGSGGTGATGDEWEFLIDRDAGTTIVKVNGTTKATVTGLPATQELFPFATFYQTSGYFIFDYTPSDTSYKTLNTQNLPAPTISNGASYMAATTFNGITGGTQTLTNTVNGVGFQPDFVWMKLRSGVQDHFLVDSVRGSSNIIVSNSTAAEITGATTFLTSFNSNGWSLGSGGYGNGVTVVGWQWNAGGSTVTNTDGSISSQVRANPTAGFSVCTFNVGASGAKTFGHGLGVAPKMVIVKSRTSALGWCTYHASATTTTSQYLQINLTSAVLSVAGIWGSTLPTSTLVGIGSGTNVNVNDDCVAYCFAAVAGYSAFGSYTGNGSTDGTFVFTGFRPRFVMFKRTDTTGDWQMYDSSRDTYNVTSNTLYANGAFAEDSNTTNRALDLLSNGFKLRSSASFLNASGGTYIYMAFAENPLKLSLAR